MTTSTITPSADSLKTSSAAPFLAEFTRVAVLALRRSATIAGIFFCNLFLLFILPGRVTSQERYWEPLFDSVTVQTLTYATKSGQNLDLDLYAPWGDPEEYRPVVLYLHGGGFSAGTRNDASIVKFCQRLAAHGYNAVSVTYRLTRKNEPTGFSCDCRATDKLNTFQSAVEDIQDATYFLTENRESLGIDPQKIILAGSSAGAEAVLNAAYQPPMCYGLDSGPVSYAGVISMAGAIPDTSKIFSDSAVPSLFFHGTCDNLVPYASASHHYCEPGKPGYLILHGAHTLAAKLAQLGVPYWLHTTCGGAHELASKPMHAFFDEILAFCHDFVLCKQTESRHTIIPGDQRRCAYGQYDFCNEP